MQYAALRGPWNLPHTRTVRPGFVLKEFSPGQGPRRRRHKKSHRGRLEAAGKATGNRRLEAKGRADKAEGRVRSAVGKATDAIRELVGDKH